MLFEAKRRERRRTACRSAPRRQRGGLAERGVNRIASRHGLLPRQVRMCVFCRTRPAPSLPPSERGVARSAGGSTPCAARPAPTPHPGSSWLRVRPATRPVPHGVLPQSRFARQPPLGGAFAKPPPRTPPRRRTRRSMATPNKPTLSRRVAARSAKPVQHLRVAPRLRVRKGTRTSAARPTMVPSAARWYEASVAGSRSATSEPSRMRSERESRERSHAARRAAGEGGGKTEDARQRRSARRRRASAARARARPRASARERRWPMPSPRPEIARRPSVTGQQRTASSRSPIGRLVRETGQELGRGGVREGAGRSGLAEVRRGPRARARAARTAAARVQLGGAGRSHARHAPPGGGSPPSGAPAAAGGGGIRRTWGKDSPRGWKTK